MTEKKRILTICKGHQNIAGAQLYMQQLAVSFDPNAYELQYAFHFEDGARVFNEIEKIRPVVTWEYDWRHLGFKKSFHSAADLFNKTKPHMVIYNSSEDQIIPAILAGYLCRVPSQAMVVHWAQAADSLPLIVKKKAIPFPLPSRYGMVTRLKRSLTYALLDKIIFVNQMTRKAYSKLYGVPRAKCATIYNGIDLKKFAVPENAGRVTRKLLSVQDDQTMLLATGNLSPVKGHRVLIDAVEMLLAKKKKVKCFIAGQGELEPSLREYINSKGLTGKVDLLGYRDDIPELLAATDIFCMPSLNEALGYSLLEAMAAGKPVVASEVGGIPEVVKDSCNGLLVPPGNPEALSEAINRLMEDKHKRENFCKRAVQDINEKFSINRMMTTTTRFLTL